jgi:hypothetical protein
MFGLFIAIVVASLQHKSPTHLVTILVFFLLFSHQICSMSGRVTSTHLKSLFIIDVLNKEQNQDNSFEYGSESNNTNGTHSPDFTFK